VDDEPLSNRLQRRLGDALDRADRAEAERDELRRQVAAVRFIADWWADAENHDDIDWLKSSKITRLEAARVASAAIYEALDGGGSGA